MLHEHSPTLDRDSLIRYARELSLDMGRFTRDLDTMRHKKEIDRDVKLAEELDLYNTPTFFINGIRLQGNRPFEQFKEIIDRELGSSAKKSGDAK